MSPNICPNPDIDNIPTNDTGTFIENITVGCSFCRQRFDRPDEYRLHHGEKHAKIYGILPELVTNSAQDVNIINASAESSTSTLEVINSAASIRKRRLSCVPSVSYVDEDIESSSSSDSDTSDDDVDDKSSENSGQRLQEPGTSSNDLPEKTNDRESQRTESRKTRKRLLKKPKERDSNSSSDSSLEHDIRNTINKFVQKLSKKLMTHLKNQILKEQINQNNILYKCNKCSLHFLKKRKLFKHLKKGKHTELQQVQCEHCMLQFSKRSMQKHVKMHMTNGHLDKNKRFKILIDNDCCFDDSSNSSTSEHSGSKNDVQIGMPISEPENSNKPVEENQNPKTNLEKDNVKNHAQTLQTNSKRLKKILYKCDDCEEHFLSRANAEIHTRNSTHHRMGKNTVCNQCTYKFSSPATLSQHERLHHNELNLSKEDFKVITLTKFAPNKTRTLISKRMISESQQNNLDKKHKVNELVDRALLYRCEGCNQSLTSKTTLLRHIRTCESKSSRKYLCEKCQLYFITKYTLTRHLKVHKKYPQLKKEDFMVISRRPRIQKNTSVPQSNIVSTTEGNHNDSVIEQGYSKTVNVCENDTCKVKHSKSTENCLSVVTNNEKNGEKSSSFNRHNNEIINKDQQMTINNDINKTATSISVEQSFGNDNNVTDHPDTLVENEISVDSTNNSNHEFYSTSTETAINLDSTNNQNSLNSLDLAETNVRNISEQNMVVKSTYFQKPQVKTTVELNADGIIIDMKECSKDNGYSDANSSRVIYQNKNDQNEDAVPFFGIKPEICDRNEDNPRTENESLIEDIVNYDGIISKSRNNVLNQSESLKEKIVDNDSIISDTQKNDLNPTGIKIANSFSIEPKFEDSDTQEPSSTQVTDENVTELSNSPNPQPEIKNKCDILTNIKDENIKQLDKNIAKHETNIMTASQISYRNHDNSFHHSDDSQNTLMLVDDDDQIDELAEENLDMINVIHSSKSNISYPTIAIPVNKSTECSGEADCNVLLVKDFINEHAVSNGINNIGSQEIKDKVYCSKSFPSYKNINENCIGKTSTLNFVDASFRVRDRRSSSCKVIECKTTSGNLKKESVTKGQNKSRKQIRQHIDSQEVIEICDSDDDDENDAVVLISKDVETVDLT